MTPLIATTALRAGYATGDVLQDVSVEVGTGEVVGVLGRNGVGKSTLMRALIGLLPARNGMIVYQGNDITRQAANRRAALGIGYVPQGREVFAQMSVLDNLRMGQFIDRSRQFDP
ncbi:MAG TPA: ATP-binding cassette domain-containing protein, partial [Casimicrobiaceae bacterium]|nr:ATP-binding cassette domain-containing protein [Casimicrobiaceae bacterium]